MGSCKQSRDKDFSLNVEEYKEFGMPDPDKIWKGEDYAQAYRVLSQIKSDKPLSLPRKGSKKSAPYFNRLISLDNISFLNDESIPLKERAYRIQSFILIQSDLTDIYTDIYKHDQYYSTELIDLYLFGLSVTQKMLELSYKINDSEDEEDIEIRSGFPGIQYTYLTMLSFILNKQKNSSVYRIQDLERLADSLSNSILKNEAWMETVTRNNLKQQIQTVMDSVTSIHIEDKYNHLIEVL
jgi:hypothetical protein